jgi:hypothetical protein
MRAPYQVNWLAQWWIGGRESDLGWPILWIAFSFSFLGFGLNPLLSIIALGFFTYVETCAWVYWLDIDLGRWFGARQAPVPTYQEALEMLGKSPDPIERNSIYLGTVLGPGWPVLAPPDLFREGVQVTGPAGAWKSSGTVEPILFQKIARADEVIIILDLGGDASSVHKYRDAAKRAGIPFYLFTTDPEKKSHVFNPLTQSHLRPGEKLGQMFCQALGITGPGRSPDDAFFASQAEQLGIKEFELLNRPTFREVMAKVDELSLGDRVKVFGLSARSIEFGERVNLDLRAASNVLGMNGPDSAESIDFKRIISHGAALVYFSNSVTEDMTGAVISSLLPIHALMGAAHRMPRNHTPVTLVIEEAQTLLLAGVMLQPLYQQMRKFGISVWTIHQCMEDLAHARENVLPMVVNNSLIGIHLGVRDPIGRDHIEKIGGKIKVPRPTKNSQGEISETEIWEPRITTPDFDLVNGYRGLAFMTINGRSGYCSFNHPFIAQVPGFTCSWEKYQEYLAMPWPKLTNAVDRSNFMPIVTAPKVKTPAEKNVAAMAALAALAAHRPETYVR